MHNNQLTSYIAQSELPRAEMELYVRDLTERSFPCITSKTITESESVNYLQDIITTLTADSLAFFLMFVDNMVPCLCMFELGLALKTKATIVFIGSRLPKDFIPLIDGKKIISAYDYDNFIYQRFLDGGTIDKS